MTKFYAERKSDGKKYLPEQTAITGDGTIFAVFEEESDDWQYVESEEYELIIRVN